MFRQDWEYCRFTAEYVACWAGGTLIHSSEDSAKTKSPLRTLKHPIPKRHSVSIFGVMDWNITTKTTILIWNPNCRTSKFTYYETRNYWSDHAETKSLEWILIKHRHKCHVKECICTRVGLTQPLKSRDCEQTVRTSARGTEHIPKALGVSQRCRTVRQSIPAV